MPEHVIRAAYDDTTIRVYQAFRPEIARAALLARRLVPPFQMERMTWIKPSFNWMMYRSGYGTKPGQEVVLAIDITRKGFEWALGNAVLTRYLPSKDRYDDWRVMLDKSPVRVQWDPERDYRLNIIKGVRAIQIGLSGEAVDQYVNEWTTNIEDVTPIARRLAQDVKAGITPDYLPDRMEAPYPLPELVREKICAE